MFTPNQNLNRFISDDLPQLQVLELIPVLQQLRVDIGALDKRYAIDAEEALVYVGDFLSCYEWLMLFVGRDDQIIQVIDLWCSCVDQLEV